MVFVWLELTMKNFNNSLLIIGLCLTLGLAPFFPEPHIVGKLRWISGGAVGMKPMDWLDTLFHGLPWIALVAMVLRKVFKRVAGR
jgi:cell division protein FtsW (lipid II flippase)